MAAPRTGPEHHAVGRLRLRTTLVCALALMTLMACGNPAHDPDPIDGWETPHPTRPPQQGNTGHNAEDEDNSGENGGTSSTRSASDRNAALETVRAWVRAETTAYRGGDRGRLRDLAASGCQPCSKALDSIAEVYANDGRLRDRYTQTITFIQGVSGTSPPAVQTIIDRSARVLLDANGDVRERVPASQDVLEFRTVKEGSQWLIADIISATR